MVSLKSKAICILADVYEVPPDPGPAIQAEPHINVMINSDHQEWEESTLGMPRHELELKKFISTNLRYEETMYRI